MIAIVPAPLIRSGGREFEGRKRAGQGRCLKPVGRGEQHDISLQRPGPVEAEGEAVALLDAGGGDGIDDFELDIAPSLHRLEEALAHIFAEELARQECMREAIMQAGVILALVELAKSPVEKIAGLACAHREIAGAHIEKVQGMMRTVGDAAAKRSAWLDHDEVERPIEAR